MFAKATSVLRLTRSSQAAIYIAAIALIIVANDLRTLMRADASSIQGWEYELVAQSIADGHGFSFEGPQRWLFEDDRVGEYAPTAWEEPIYTYLLGFFLGAFGEEGKTAMLLMHELFFVLTVIGTFFIAKQMGGPLAGCVAAGLFLLVPARGALEYLNNSMFSGLLIILNVFLVFRMLRLETLRSAGTAGVGFGVLVLTHASTVFFGAVTAFVVLVFGETTWLNRSKLIGVLVTCMAVTMSPWVIRNYIVFDQIVPTKNGAGIIAYAGSPALARTYSTESLPDREPPWTAKGYWDALNKMEANGERYMELVRYGLDVVREDAGESFDALNEAQRDRLLLREVRQFVVDRPLEWISISAAKGLRYFLYSWRGQVGHLPLLLIVTCGAGLALLYGLKDRRVVCLGLFVAAFSVAYVISIPLYYRYRYPIEPLIFVLFGYLVARIASQVTSVRESQTASTVG